MIYAHDVGELWAYEWVREGVKTRRETSTMIDSLPHMSMSMSIVDLYSACINAKPLIRWHTRDCLLRTVLKRVYTRSLWRATDRNVNSQHRVNGTLMYIIHCDWLSVVRPWHCCTDCLLGSRHLQIANICNVLSLYCVFRCFIALFRNFWYEALLMHCACTERTNRILPPPRRSCFTRSSYVSLLPTPRKILNGSSWNF